MNITRITCSALLFALLGPCCELALAGVAEPRISVFKDGDLLSKVGDEIEYTIVVEYDGPPEGPRLVCRV